MAQGQKRSELFTCEPLAAFIEKGDSISPQRLGQNVQQYLQAKDGEFNSREDQLQHYPQQS